MVGRQTDAKLQRKYEVSIEKLSMYKYTKRLQGNKYVRFASL